MAQIYNAAKEDKTGEGSASSSEEDGANDDLAPPEFGRWPAVFWTSTYKALFAELDSDGSGYLLFSAS